MDSILTSIKKMLGLEEDNIQFDPDIIIHINTVLMIMNQLGVGPDTGFIVTTKDQKWTDFIADKKDIEGVKTYIYLKVKLIFDPPTSSFVLESIKEMIKELEGRILCQVEYIIPVVSTDPTGTITTTTTTVTTTTTTVETVPITPA